MNTKSKQAKTLKRATQVVLVHLVLFSVVFSNEPLRIDGPHATIYDALKNGLDIRFTYGLFGYPRAQNTRVTFLVKYASGKSVEWSPVELDNVSFFDKGHEAIFRSWCDENIGDYGLKTHKLLLRDAALYAIRELEKPDDKIVAVEIYKTSTSIAPPGSNEPPHVVERLMLYSMSPDAESGIAPASKS